MAIRVRDAAVAEGVTRVQFDDVAAHGACSAVELLDVLDAGYAESDVDVPTGGFDVILVVRGEQPAARIGGDHSAYL